MEKRFVVFLVIAISIWAGYVGLRMWLAPAPVAVAENATESSDPEKAVVDKSADNQPDVSVVGKPETETPSSSAGTDSVDVPSSAETDKPPIKTSANPRKRFTLGSADPASPYRMLVTLDSRGAAVERIELSSDRYYDLEDKTGYLGQLALTDAPQGAQVNVVGAGTPAALAVASGSGEAGLQAGDVIVRFDDAIVSDVSVLEELLKKTKPGQSVKLSVQRPAAAKAEATDEAAAEQTAAKPTLLDLTATLTRRPLEVIRPERPLIEGADGAESYGPQSPPALLMSFENLGGKSLKIQDEEFKGMPSLRNSDWKIEDQGADFVAFSSEFEAPAVGEMAKASPMKVIKRYTMAKPAADSTQPYHLDLQIEVQNQGDAERQIAYRIDGPNGLPLEGWWYSVKLHPKMMKGAGARDVVYREKGADYHLFGCPEVVSAAREAITADKPVDISLLTTDKPQEIDFAGIDAQFFSSVLMPQPGPDAKPILFSRVTAMPLQDVMKLDKARNKTCNTSVRLVTSGEMVGPKQSLVHNYHLFAGPKEPQLLDNYKIGELIEYGWSYAAIPAKTLRYVLETIHMAVPNWGICIILLTLLVRSCMVPFSLKQAKSAATMQALAPEMAKIKEKYADDMEGQGKAMRELYAKHNFNPFGGCLLLVFQLPVFVGLYRCLSVDIELRDASLIPGLSWASNLAGPDMLYYWKPYLWPVIANEAHGWFGPYFNFFPLVTVSLFLLQQKLFTPPATDEQTRMQQKMMTYMTVFMGVMFYKVPAGLCLYFITSSLWSVCERKLLNKPKPLAPAGVVDGKATPSAPERRIASNGTAAKQAKKQKRR